MIDIILHIGRSALKVALYTLLPVIVVMMIVVGVVEAFGAQCVSTRRAN